jgi:hypothetical protein
MLSKGSAGAAYVAALVVVWAPEGAVLQQNET